MGVVGASHLPLPSMAKQGYAACRRSRGCRRETAPRRVARLAGGRPEVISDATTMGSGPASHLQAVGDQAAALRAVDSPPGLRQFGTPEPGRDQRIREGAYAIVVDRDRILVIDDGRRFFLPGGGVEPGEDGAAALRRELREETGHDLTAAAPF